MIQSSNVDPIFASLDPNIHFIKKVGFYSGSNLSTNLILKFTESGTTLYFFLQIYICFCIFISRIMQLMFYSSKMITKKDKNHKTGSEEVENGGMIPFLQLGEFNNPGNINFKKHTFTNIKLKILTLS